MPQKINKEKLKAFILRRKLNAFGLLTITVLSAVITLLCVLTGFAHTDILVIVTILLVLLCFLQAYKLRSSFRTIPSFKGSRKKKRKPSAECES